MPNRHLTDTDIAENRTEGSPRLFIRTDDPIVLTTSWQIIHFNIPSVNTNTFSYNVWDSATNKILANPNISFDQNYNLKLDIRVSGGLRPADIQIRFRIPSTPEVFFPIDSEGYTYQVERFTLDTETLSFPIFMGANWRSFGCFIEIKSSLVLATQPTLLGRELLLVRNN